eukprot:1987800-Pyramimonas_sp.AAC.1
MLNDAGLSAHDNEKADPQSVNRGVMLDGVRSAARAAMKILALELVCHVSVGCWPAELSVRRV